MLHIFLSTLLQQGTTCPQVEIINQKLSAKFMQFAIQLRDEEDNIANSEAILYHLIF